MRTEIATMNDFAEAVREEMQDRLSTLFPGIKAEVQQVDKIQGESYLGLRIDKGDGLASPVFNLEPAYAEAQRTGSFDRVLDTFEEKIGMVLQDMADSTYFKIFMADVGLLRRKTGVYYKTILNGDDLYIRFKGALAENYAASQLAFRLTD